MGKVNFYLKDNQAKEPTNINLFYSYSKERLKWYTGMKIHPADWSFPRKRPKRNPELSRYLDNLAERVQRVHAEFLISGTIPTKTQLKEKLNELYRDLPKSKESFLTLLNHYIDDNPVGVASNTLRQFRTLHRYLLEFRLKTRYKLEFEAINNHFDQAFYEYLINKESPLSPSSINKVYGNLKTFLTYATRSGHNSNMAYQTFEHKRKSVDHIALSGKEVDSLKKLKLSGQDELYRDVFLFSCETAMEFSAIGKLKPQDLKQGTFEGVNEGQPLDYAEYYRSKTSQKVTPPLSKLALRIIRKYRSKKLATCFPKLSNQVYNRKIKELAEKAGINSPIEIIEYKGAEKQTNTYLKYELITTHTGRRTFVTLFIERGGSNEACRVYTGHSSNKQLEQYRKQTLQHKMTLAFQQADHKPFMNKVS